LWIIGAVAVVAALRLDLPYVVGILVFGPPSPFF
jgi:hypothetical protein